MKIIMKKYSYHFLVSILLFFMLYTIASIHRYLIRITEQDDIKNGENKVIKLTSFKSDEFFEIDFDKLDDNSGSNVVYERCLEEISKLKAKIKTLETKLNRCEFRRKSSRTNGTDQSSELNVDENQIALESEVDLFTYSAFTYDKLFSPNSDIYHRNVIKLSGLRKAEVRKVVEKSLEFLNAIKPSVNFSIGDFKIGFTRSTPQSSGYEYELFFRNPTTSDGQCCAHLRMRRALKPALELVDLNTAMVEEDALTETRKVINFVLPLSGGEHNENAFRLFLSSFESVVVNEDAGQASLLIAFQGTHADFNWFNSLVKEFKMRTKFGAVRFVRMAAQKERFSRAKSIQKGIDNLNCDPNDCLIFICDVDVLFNRNFLDLCSFYNPLMLKSKHFSEGSLEDNNNNNLDEADDSSKKLNLIINKESGFWRETGFGMACMHREDFRAVSGFSGFDDDPNKPSSWGGEDLFLVRKFLRRRNSVAAFSVFRAITPGLFHMYHAKECAIENFASSPRLYFDCLTAKIYNEASHRDFGLIHFNITQPAT